MSVARTGSVGIGVIGARSYVATNAVMPAIDASDGAHLVASAARSGAVDDRWLHTRVDDYDDVLAHPDVEAVYIPLPNGMHLDWTERAAAAGRHVLCEKPLAPDADTARRMRDVCADAGVLLAEAYMTPFHRRYDHLLSMVREGAIGTVETIDARFTFTIGPDAADNYRWDPGQGGGALLDVGIYCLGPIVELFDARPERVTSGIEYSASGVDASAHALLTWSGRRHGSIQCSFVDEEQQYLSIVGSSGRLVLDNQAFTGGDNDTRVRSSDTDTADHGIQTVATNDPYLAMVDAFADAVRGRSEWTRTAQRSIEMLELIERIRTAAR